jgi:hypothetical protein
MDGGGCTYFTGPGCGSVNAQYYAPGSDCSGYEKFNLVSLGGTQYGLQSVAFPNAYIRMDGSSCTTFSGPGCGTINGQYYATGTTPSNNYEVLNIIPIPLTCTTLYTGQSLSNGVRFQIKETKTGKYLTSQQISWSNNPTAVMFKSSQTATFNFPNVSPFNGGHMGILTQANVGSFDLDGGHGGILTVSAAPGFNVNFIPDGQGGVSIKAVQCNYNSNQYNLDIQLINGEYCLTYGNINFNGSYRVYLC